MTESNRNTDKAGAADKIAKACEIAKADKAAKTDKSGAASLTREEIESAFTAFLKDDLTRQGQMVNGMMAPTFVDADPDAMSVTLAFTVHPWEINRAGGLHGGVMASMLDHTLGLTAACYLGHWAPTLSLNIDYIRPANLDDKLLAKATVLSLGRRIIRMRGELLQAQTGKLVASCSATFFNKE